MKKLHLVKKMYMSMKQMTFWVLWMQFCSQMASKLPKRLQIAFFLANNQTNKTKQKKQFQESVGF